MHKAGDLLAASGIQSWVLRQSMMYLKQARMVAKHHEERWTKAYLQPESSDVNQAERVPEARKTGLRDGKTTLTRIYNQPVPTETKISRATRPGSPRHKLERHGTPWKATLFAADSRNQHDPRPPSSQLRQPRQHPNQQIFTTTAHDQNEERKTTKTKKTTRHCPSTQWNLRNTSVTTANKPTDTATRVFTTHSF